MYEAFGLGLSLTVKDGRASHADIFNGNLGIFQGIQEFAATIDTGN